jgi:hypothetical protein
MKKLLIIFILIIGIVFISGCTSENKTNSETSIESQKNQEFYTDLPTQSPTIQDTLDVQTILSIRQNYKIELIDWQKRTCYTDSYSDDLYLDLKITNNNEEKKLDYLTIRFNQFDSFGELIGWGRTSVKVRTLEPQTSDYALSCIKEASLPLTTKVTIELEENPPEDAYQFYKELQ